MSSLENWSKENYIPYTPESKRYISIAREMKKLAEMDGELIDSESDKRFVALAKEVEEAGERGYLYPEDKKN